MFDYFLLSCAARCDQERKKKKKCQSNKPDSKEGAKREVILVRTSSLLSR